MYLLVKALPPVGRKRAEIAIDQHDHILSGRQFVLEVVGLQIGDVEPFGACRGAGMGERVLGKIEPGDMAATAGDCTGVKAGTAAEIGDRLARKPEPGIEPADNVGDEAWPARGGITVRIEMGGQHLPGAVRIGPQGVGGVRGKGSGAFEERVEIFVHEGHPQ